MLRILLPTILLIILSYHAPVNNYINEEKTILFSGLEWKVRTTVSAQGPGPNYFSEQSVWVDDKGFLHLYLNKDSLRGKWLCPEITTEKDFGYGLYSFTVEGAIDKLDKNVVLGLFNYSGKDGYDEMDIEFGRWGNAKYPNLNYTVWPAQKEFKNSSFTKEYQQKNNYSIQQFSRSKDSVIFTTFDGNTREEKNIAATYNCIQPPASISNLLMPVHINLWLFDGNPPQDNKPVEIIIDNFSFQK